MFTRSRPPPPESWEEFEKIVCSASKLRWKPTDFFINGRPGQSQFGVDVYGQTTENKFIGLQCKKRSSPITKKFIETAIQKAENFSPRLDNFYLATTLKKDQKIQGIVRTVSAERIAKNKFSVDILFWDDIVESLKLDEDILFQHFPELKPGCLTHDQSLFEEFKSIFPFEPTVRILQRHNFTYSFRLSDLQSLDTFVEAWDHQEKTFLDPELQDALTELYMASRTMNTHIENFTGPTAQNEYASVYSETQRAAGPRPSWIKEEAIALNEQAKRCVSSYNTFIKKCREKLVR